MMQITQKDIKYFNVAKTVARTSEYPRIKIGSCIVKKNKILGVGINMVKSHPTQKIYNKNRGIDINRIYNNIHAELDAILKVANKKDLEGASIYLYRENSTGEIRMCRPCSACMALLQKYHLRYIYYTNEGNLCKEEIC